MGSGALERDDVEKALTTKGFTQKDDGDHKYFQLVIAGRNTGIYTKTSRGTKHRTIGADNVAAMAKQVKLTAKAFRSFVECSLTQDAYVQELRQREEL
jgi:hypothetical protein